MQRRASVVVFDRHAISFVDQTHLTYVVDTRGCPAYPVTRQSKWSGNRLRRVSSKGSRHAKRIVGEHGFDGQPNGAIGRVGPK